MRVYVRMCVCVYQSIDFRRRVVTACLHPFSRFNLHFTLRVREVHVLFVHHQLPMPPTLARRSRDLSRMYTLAKTCLLCIVACAIARIDGRLRSNAFAECNAVPLLLRRSPFGFT